MNLAELKQAIKEERIAQAGRTTLIWGPPRTGKTRWAATIAKAPQIKKVFLFDYENGAETIINAKNKDGTPYFSDAELAKIQLIRVMDLPDNPRAVKLTDTVFRNYRRDQYIDSETGDWIKNPPVNTKDSLIHISPDDWNRETAFILDTIGQIGQSAYNEAVLDMPDAKDIRRWYGAATIRLNNIFTMIQACPAYVIACTHVLENEVILSRDSSGNPTRTKVDWYPLCLSKNYSMNVGKSFGSIIFRYIELNKFAHISSPTKKSGIQAGTRTDVDVSADLDMTLPEVLKLVQAKVEAEAKAEAKPSSLLRKS
jgi:AAA domain